MIFQGEKRATDVETGAQVTDGQQNLTEPRLPGEEVSQPQRHHFSRHLIFLGNLGQLRRPGESLQLVLISQGLCCPRLLDKSTRDNHVSQYGCASHGPNPERSSYESVCWPGCLRCLLPRVRFHTISSRPPCRNVWAEADMANWKPLVYCLEFSLSHRMLCGLDDHWEIYERVWSLCWSYRMCTTSSGHRHNN